MDHHHEHHEGCGACCGHGCHHAKGPLTEREKAILRELAQMAFLPVARFLLKSSRSEHLQAVAMAPVYIGEGADTLASVRDAAEALDSLCAQGLLTIDYELALSQFDEAVYRDSPAYAEFSQIVSEGAKNPDFLFDVASIDFGSAALTLTGQETIETLEYTAP